MASIPAPQMLWVHAMQLSLALDERPVMSTIRTRLLARFGRQRDDWRLDPVSQLVCSLISPRTEDEVSLAAFERLRRRYPSWDALRHAAPKDIEAIIRPVTYAEKKAVYLPRALCMIVARSGCLDLEFLTDWDEEMSVQWLRGLPGVGPKVAAAVLNFSTLRKRTLAVDTHLLRIGQRLGLLPADADYDAGYDGFMRLVPDEWEADDTYEFHWLMKYHGQRVCRDAAPVCPGCVLRDLCQFYGS
jgi:endonuclease-3